VEHLDLLTKIRLSSKNYHGKNTLAYLSRATVMKSKKGLLDCHLADGLLGDGIAELWTNAIKTLLC
jgi:hypothetical protein